MRKRWQVLLEGLEERFGEVLKDLEKEFQTREDELKALNEIDKRIIERIDLQETYNFILGKTKELLRARYAQLLIRKRDKLEVVASTDPNNIGLTVLVNKSVCGRSIQNGNIVNCGNVREGEYSEVYQDHLSTPVEKMMSELVAPIIVDGFPIAAINIESPKPAAFDLHDEQMVKTLADQAALAIVHARLIDEVSLFAEIEERLFSESHDAPLQRTLHVIANKLKELLPTQSIEVQILFRKANDTLEVEYSSIPENVGISVTITDSVCGEAIQTKRPVIVEDVSKDDRYKRMLGANIRSEIAAPIINRDRAVGVINVESPEIGVFDPYFQYVLQRFSHEVSNVFALVKLKEDLQNAKEYQQSTELLVAIGDQAGNIIHRLNNTVGAMKVWLREIQLSCKKELDENEFLRDRIDDLLRGAEETLRLPQEIKKAIKTGIQDTDVNAALGETLKRMKIPKNISVECCLASELPKARCYSFDIVARNLIQNAIDAMPDGGHLRIYSKLISYDDIDDRNIEIKVEDTGKGISENEMRKIFNINYTTKKEKEGKGLGYGLWWVKNFVTRVRGEICVRSKEGGGTTFAIKLPVSQ